MASKNYLVDAVFCDDCVESNRKTKILDTIQCSNKLNDKLDRLERSIEQYIETRVKTVFEKCEGHIEELVNTVIEKKLNLKSIRFRKVDSKDKSEKQHNILSSFRLRSLPEDLTKSKEEHAILANEKLKDVKNKKRIEVKIDKVHRLGKFDRERSTLGNTIVTLSNNWDVRIVLAKIAEKRTRRKDGHTHSSCTFCRRRETGKFVPEKTARTLD